MRQWSAHLAGFGLVTVPGYETGEPPSQWFVPYYPGPPIFDPNVSDDEVIQQTVHQLVYRLERHGGYEAHYVPDERIDGNVERCIEAAYAEDERREREGRERDFRGLDALGQIELDPGKRPGYKPSWAKPAS